MTDEDNRSTDQIADDTMTLAFGEELEVVVAMKSGAQFVGQLVGTSPHVVIIDEHLPAVLDFRPKTTVRHILMESEVASFSVSIPTPETDE